MLWRHFETSEQIDRQYDVAVWQPPALGVNEGKAERSAEARATLPCTLDIPYGDTPRQVLDVFPAEAPGAPVLIYIHGGYWRSLTASKDTTQYVAFGTRPRGVTLVVVEYDLCPDVTLEVLTEQVRRSVEWVHGNIADHGGDPGRIHVCGNSAGGHLTMEMACTDWAARGLPADVIRGATPFSGLYDLMPFRWGFLEKDLGLDHARALACSPVTKARPGCPALIVWGGDETAEFAWQAAQMEGAWARAGNAVRMAEIPGRDHFTVSAGPVEPGDSDFGRVFWPFFRETTS